MDMLQDMARNRRPLPAMESEMSIVWDELKKFARAGEALFENIEEHVAILLARKLDDDRRKEIVAAIDVAVAPAPAPAEPVGTSGTGGADNTPAPAPAVADPVPVDTPVDTSATPAQGA